MLLNRLNKLSTFKSSLVKILVGGTLLLQSILVAAVDIAELEPSKTWSDGTRYYGVFKNDKREGEGRIVWANGTQFLGNFENDLREGQGRLILSDGASFVAMYKRDVIVSDTIAQEANRMSVPNSDVFIKEMNRQISSEVANELVKWQQAWANQSLSDYFSQYSSRFIPLDGASFSSWKQLRAVRINRPESIKIEIKEPKYQVQGDDTVVVSFEQSYASNLYSDNTFKTLTFQRELGGWKITSESTGNR